MTPAALAAFCSIHRATPASLACDRCGTFSCAACFTFIGERTFCLACLLRSLDQLRPITSLSVATVILMRVSSVSIALNAVTESMGVAVWARGLLAVPGCFAQLATLAVFSLWFHRAVKWSLALGEVAGISPEWALASWFVPVVNLITPFNVMRAMSPGANVTAWQVTWLGGGLVTFFAVLSVNTQAFLAGALATGVSGLIAAHCVASATATLESAALAKREKSLAS